MSLTASTSAGGEALQPIHAAKDELIELKIIKEEK